MAVYTLSCWQPFHFQSSRVDIINEGGFRSDGRRQFELRTIEMDLSQQGQADGSAMISHGLTQVLVSVFGPREPKMRSQAIHDRTNINVDVSMAAFSTSDRRQRSRGDKWILIFFALFFYAPLIFKDRRILEFAATIKATFEPVVQTSLYPRSQIDIFVQVIQQDGGLLQAAINGTTLALMNAGIPMLDFVCAISGGVHSKFPLLDLNTLEENDMPNVTIAIMPKTRKVSLVTMETRLHVDRFEELFRVAVDAGKVIQEEMKATILGQSSGLIRSMQIGNQNQNKDFGDVVNE